MHVLINDKPIHCTSDDTLLSVLNIYCQARNIDVHEVAVAQDVNLIPRATWSARTLRDTESFSVFSAVAGG